jgi:adenine-specific DNA glycosylase
VKVTLAALVFVDARGRTLLLPSPHHQDKSATPDHVPTLVSRMWHFPTIAVSKENEEAELHNLVQQFLQKRRRGAPHVLEPLSRVRHAVTYREITLLPFRIALKNLPGVPGAKTIALEELCSHSSLAVSNLTRKVACAASNTVP